MDSNSAIYQSTLRSSSSICAVVVTYNRKTLLQRCISSLLSQSQPLDGILIVDNASTDGTLQHIRACKLLIEDRVKYFCLPENVGGAGGFYEGIKRGLSLEYDFFWSMDDDCYPHRDALKNLVCSPGYHHPKTIVGSLVVSDSDKQSLVWKYPLPNSRSALFGSRKWTSDISVLRQSSSQFGYPGLAIFNGALLPRAAFTSVGLPKKDFFIWGDDTEFLYRVQRGGFETFTVLNSIMYHPEIPEVNNAPKWKQMYGARNNTYIFTKYRTPIQALLKVTQAICTSILAGKFYLLRAIWHGCCRDFSARYHEEG